MDLDLYIDCPLGTTLRLVASACDTVLSIKLRLQALLRNSLPANQQRLVWRAYELANERRLAEYGVVSGCTLRLLPHLHAGPASLCQLPMPATPPQPSPPSNPAELQPKLIALAANYRQAWEHLQQYFLHHHHQQQQQQHILHHHHHQQQQQQHILHHHHQQQQQQHILHNHHQQQQQPLAMPNAAEASYYLVYCLRPNAATASVNGGGHGHAFDLVGISCCLAMPRTMPAAEVASADEAANQSGPTFEDSNSTTMPESADEAAATVVDTSRCYACHRRTGITGSFACRCGRAYCARHRYPESHACSYDYKAEGRQLISEANPRVLAPKLQRI